MRWTHFLRELFFFDKAISATFVSITCLLSSPFCHHEDWMEGWIYVLIHGAAQRRFLFLFFSFFPLGLDFSSYYCYCHHYYYFTGLLFARHRQGGLGRNG